MLFWQGGPKTKGRKVEYKSDDHGDFIRAVPVICIGRSKHVRRLTVLRGVYCLIGKARLGSCMHDRAKSVPEIRFEASLYVPLSHLSSAVRLPIPYSSSANSATAAEHRFRRRLRTSCRSLSPTAFTEARLIGA